MLAGRRTFVVGLVLGLAAGCSSGHHQRSADPPHPRGTGTPDPCALVTRKEVQAALHEPVTPPQRTTSVFGRTPEPGQRVCEFIPDRVNAVGTADMVVYPDPDGTKLLAAKAAMQQNPNFSSDVTFPGGLGPGAVKSGEMLFARKRGYTLGLRTYGASDANFLKLAKTAYRRV